VLYIAQRRVEVRPHLLRSYVGWYMCEKWYNCDKRKAKTPKVMVDELRKQLQEQSDQLQASVPAISDLKLLILDLSL
jgi:hypothetical protein